MRGLNKVTLIGNLGDVPDYQLLDGNIAVAKNYLKKGSMVYIEGKLKTRSYDSSDGSKRYVTEIIAEQLIMLDKRPETDAK